MCVSVCVCVCVFQGLLTNQGFRTLKMVEIECGIREGLLTVTLQDRCIFWLIDLCICCLLICCASKCCLTVIPSIDLHNYKHQTKRECSHSMKRGSVWRLDWSVH